MYKQEIYETLRSEDGEFYRKSIKIFNKVLFDEKENLFLVPENRYVLEILRITLNRLQNMHIYIYTKKKEECTNYVMKLIDENKKKFLTEIKNISEKYPNIFFGTSENPPNMHFQKKGDYNLVNIIISKNVQKFRDEFYEIKIKEGSLYDVSRCIFGKKIFKFMVGDNVRDNIYFQELYSKLITLPSDTRDKIICFGKSFYKIIGMTKKIEYVSDDEMNDAQRKEIDIIVPEDVMSMFGKYRCHSLEEYEIFVSSVRDHNIINYKCINFFPIEKMMEEQVKMTDNFTDLYMFKKKYENENEICIPNLEIKHNELIVFDQKNTEKLYDAMRKKLREEYGQKTTEEELRDNVRKCTPRGFDIYKGKTRGNRDTGIVKSFHLDVKKQIYRKYCGGVDKLLDMGCGRLTDLFFWNENNINWVYCVEPSKASIKSGQEKLEEMRIMKTKINVTEGEGDVDWESDNKYEEILEHRYDVIVFQYTIHYMLDKIDKLMGNLNRIVKKRTKIIITCMDGDLIEKEMRRGNIIVRNERREIIFAIAKENEKNILVYLKGGYGLENGSIERIVEVGKVIEEFRRNGFGLVERKPFLEYKSKIGNKMRKYQREISKYYTSIILERRDS